MKDLPAVTNSGGEDEIALVSAVSSSTRTAAGRFQLGDDFGNRLRLMSVARSMRGFTPSALQRPRLQRSLIPIPSPGGRRC